MASLRPLEVCAASLVAHRVYPSSVCVCMSVCHSAHANPGLFTSAVDSHPYSIAESICLSVLSVTYFVSFPLPPSSSLFPFLSLFRCLPLFSFPFCLLFPPLPIPHLLSSSSYPFRPLSPPLSAFNPNLKFLTLSSNCEGEKAKSYRPIRLI